MTKPKRKLFKIIRRSCLTGAAVWVIQGRSRGTDRIRYWRVCRKEIQRVARWRETIEARKANIARMISGLTANMPALGYIPPAAEEALKVLRRMADKEPENDLTFYNHIMEERRRRKEDEKKQE